MRWYALISALLSAVAVAPLTGAAFCQTPPTIEIPVLVLDHQGQPVLGLNSDYFRLSDNGRRQRILRFESAERPVSLALVVDTEDAGARIQAGRSAEIVTAMLMGQGGEATVYTAGSAMRLLVSFTTDQEKVVHALRHLAVAPVAPLGSSPVSDAARAALLALSHRPPGRAPAVLILAPSSARGEPGAGALLQQAREEAIAIYWLAPGSEPAATPNPDSVANAGSGAGSQRDSNTLPNQALPGRPGYENPNDVAGVNLTGAAKEAAHIATAPVMAAVDPHAGDVVYASGGVAFSPGNDVAFDQQLSAIGAYMRAVYRIYFQPDALGRAGSLHAISVQFIPPPGMKSVARLAYRRSYRAPSLAPAAKAGR